MQYSIVEEIKKSGAKLLIADDEEVIRESLRQVGTMMGFEVHTVADGAEGWEKYREVWPEFAILDIFMPKMNGLNLLKNIKNANHECKVILITGHMHYKQLSTKSDFKPDGFITKPFSMEKIILNLGKLFKQSELAKQGKSAPATA
jgi:DNA-binding NtrC family response regulator